MLDAGIDVISTVNVQHLESLNDTVFELTGVRVRETFPDRILDEADEVVLVDLSPQELQERLRAGKVYPLGRVETALANFFRAEKLGALRQLALRELSEDVEARRETQHRRPGRPAGDPRADPRAGHAAAELAAAAAPGLALGAAAGRRHRRRCGCAGAGERLPEDQTVALAALRRLAAILGAHFLEEESNDVIASVRAVVIDRGTTYVYLGTPERRRLEEVVHGRVPRPADRGAARRRHPHRRRPRPAAGARPVRLRRRRPPRPARARRGCSSRSRAGSSIRPCSRRRCGSPGPTRRCSCPPT